jgi:hypothetical protein
VFCYLLRVVQKNLWFSVSTIFHDIREMPVNMPSVPIFLLSYQLLAPPTGELAVARRPVKSVQKRSPISFILSHSDDVS